MSEEKLSVRRENVVSVCNEYLERNERPTLTKIASLFSHPNSMKLRVWFSEWKDEHKEFLSKDTRASFYRNLATERERTILVLQARILELEYVLESRLSLSR